MGWLKTSSRNISIYIILMFFSLGIANAQQDSNEFWEKVRFGGGIGLGFGNGFFSGSITPSAIYQFNPVFALGIGLNGTYNSRKDYYKSYIIGGSVLALVNPIPNIQLSAEFEELNINRSWDDYYATGKENYWYPALFLGIGYSAGNVTMGIRYDILYDRNKSIYAEPWIPFVRFYF
ncbi:alpha-ketoglutarate decarboxylase [Aegicerativicinus sediminis]|uniref:alpha-ketoglutarate decarboxylase n=1 Tax=Aegicerativicinus sediminis TaxID=2893202 RepID=UPI001E580661|nr:alpha-ketoglutarate decarboxylase [Aegicerativicinus sediminis]